MKKIRIGKDIAIHWAILTNGEPEPLQSRDLKVIILDPLRRKITITDYETDGHILSFRFSGTEQKSLGKYSLTMWENFGKVDMTAVDACNVFELVSSTCQEPTFDMENETVEWQSNIQIGVQGASAYEIAVENGFKGTVEEWLASLKGEKGDAFTYGDFTPEQIIELKKPATDAAKIANDAAGNANQAANQATQAAQSAETATRNATIAAENANAAGQSIVKLEKVIEQNEQTRISAEQSRVSSENARKQSEDSRVSAEQLRSTAETTREQQEQNRQSAEQQRVKDFNLLKQESETATNNANQATQSANSAAEKANDKATELAQFENRLSETYANYAAIEASGETDTNKIYIDGETLILYVYKNGKFEQTSGKPKGGYNRALYEAANGVVYNEERGFYELNGLTDITEEEMAVIYSQSNNIWELSTLHHKFYNVKKLRTLIPVSETKANIGVFGTFLTYWSFAFHSCSDLEVLYWCNLKAKPTNLHQCFANCTKLRKIDYLDYSNFTFYHSVAGTYTKCYSLEEVWISKIPISIEIYDSPKLKYECFKYMIDNAINKTAITIKVHPTTYSYLTGTAEPTEQVGGTTEEWQALVTTALEKQITFVSA